MKSDHVDVAVVGVLIEDELRMILAGQELDVVLDEVSLVNKVFFNDLFQYVFFEA
ncbi:MAG: hypothetical protein ISP49_21430 [Reyranella sp.]|nr:hypothetical protein [Reyranella sp.]